MLTYAVGERLKVMLLALEAGGRDTPPQTGALLPLLTKPLPLLTKRLPLLTKPLPLLTKPLTLLRKQVAFCLY